MTIHMELTKEHCCSEINNELFKCGPFWLIAQCASYEGLIIYKLLNFCFYNLDQPLSGHFSNRPQGPFMAQPLENVMSIYKKRVQLLSYDLCSTDWLSCFQSSMGWRTRAAHLDHQTGKLGSFCFVTIIIEFIWSVLVLRLSRNLLDRGYKKLNIFKSCT